MRIAVSLVAVWAGLALGAPIARAQASSQDIATARDLGQQGVEALERRDWATAHSLFERADALYRAPTLALGLARAKVGLGKLNDAHEIYVRIVREGVPPSASPPFVQAVADAKREKVALEARLPSLTITVVGAPSAVVTIDGATVPAAALGAKRFVDPGTHLIRASANGYAPVEKQVTVGEGESSSASLELQRLAPSPGSAPIGSDTTVPARDPRGPSLRRSLGFAALGLGAGAVGFGTALTVAALGDDAALQDACADDGRCDRDQEPVIDGYMRARTLAIAAAAGGAVGVGLGTTLLLTAPEDRPPAPLQRAIGFGLVGVGVAGVAVGAATGILSLGSDSSTDKGDLDRLRTFAVVGLGTGAVGIAGGALLVATAKGGGEATIRSGGVAVGPYITANGGGMRGVF